MVYDIIKHVTKAVMPSANIYKMADELPIFSLGFSFDPDVLFDLDDEKENEL